MNVYVAMVRIGTATPEPFPFSTAGAAIGFARVTAHQNAHMIEETPASGMPFIDWVYHATFPDGVVWVVERPLDGTVA